MTQGTVVVTLTDGDSFEVEPGETVLAAAQRAGVIIPYSCQSGTCRTCKSRVISGSVEHDPDYVLDLLIEEHEVAEGYRLLCSALAHSDAVIEIGG
jgi:CDP-4-dehydro-6-deoxyglucose reductase